MVRMNFVSFGLMVLISTGCANRANLVPVVENFMIKVETFPRPSVGTDCAIEEGCAEPGTLKLLRFDFLSWNKSDVDLDIGSPDDHPEWYEDSACHHHKHLKDFNTFKLYNCKNRSVVRGEKQAFCLIDLKRMSDSARTSPQFSNCNINQGVSAGWADVYNRNLDCQWINITNVPDGEYVLQATTNSNSIVPESWYGDNTTWMGLRIIAGGVTEIPVPCYPEDCIPFNTANVDVKKFNNRWKVVDGSLWILDFDSNRNDAEKARDIIKHYGMNRMCFVGRPSKGGDQLMTYFKTQSGLPTGSFAGEDCLSFNNQSVEAKEINGRWKVMDGIYAHLDFGVSEANAKKAVHIIKQYGFTHNCFVGRPDAEMQYFRK